MSSNLRLHLKGGLDSSYWWQGSVGGGFIDTHLVETDSLSESWNPTDRVQGSPKLDLGVYQYVTFSCQCGQLGGREQETLHSNWLQEIIYTQYL